MIRPFFVALLAVAAFPAFAQDEDEAHRQDRLRTQALNRQAAEAVTRRDRDQPGGTQDYVAAQRDYRDARADYQRRLAQWRAQVEACERGRYDACAER